MKRVNIFLFLCLVSFSAFAQNTKPSILDGSIVVGYYGNPKSNRMGILGEGDIPTTAKKLNEQVAKYQKITSMKVVPAFHIIYATIWPDGNLGILSDASIMPYIEYAEAHDMVVILDHQLGKKGMEKSMNDMLKFLKYDCVHLAIDPEWATTKPGKEIGRIAGADVNTAQSMMNTYIDQNNIQTKKMLIVHQFNSSMISNTSVIKTYPNVDLVHHMDGFGSPDLKMSTWSFVNTVTTMPTKGFKLFYPKSWKKDGFDKPMMTEEQVLNLTPLPKYISYQ